MHRLRFRITFRRFANLRSRLPEAKARPAPQRNTVLLDEASLSEVKSLQVNDFTCYGWFKKPLLELRQSQDLLV